VAGGRQGHRRDFDSVRLEALVAARVPREDWLPLEDSNLA
jgi:hypothetical protein